ncbi:cytochrome P450 family 808E-CYP808E1 [Chondrus crispus]|uniref:Cytochrome P450 family 808E-CYP808E1 n=1 Tax=Chondrus crispus TaxID=2769 RepID=R7Q318_CHOCR|nr:cytochrome P450 family 808E-CYP808E1 [Chondrus crispus]CDF32414.1 cytochrome P450 family 808E-CYP808E1 [Chondrus crispus]|eukprot:XP_005712079.1 cytochrome P450 family 808E-CYP808E1 [Chondrus crispus]
MDVPTAVLLVTVALILLTYLSLRTRFPHLPGPGLRAYLPNGQVLRVLQDNRLLAGTVLRLSAQYGDVFQLWLGPSEFVVTSVPDDVVHIFTKTQVFVRPRAMRAMFDAVVPGSLFTLSKPHHAQARAQLRASFNHTYLKGFHHSMRRAVDDMCEDLAVAATVHPGNNQSDLINITQYLSAAAFQIITNCAFGVDMPRQQRLAFASYANDLIGGMLLELMGYPFRQILSVFGSRKALIASKAKVDAVCAKIIRDRQQETPHHKASRASDLLDAILALDNHDAPALVSEAVTFFVAGGHTTYETLAWCIFEVSRAPRVEAAIRAELARVLGERDVHHAISFDDCEKLTYLKQVWKETLRLHPPGAFVMRTAACDVTLRGSGTRIPKGSNVISLFLGAQCSAKFWKQPETFRPERWDSATGEARRAPPGAYTPFSLGAQNCAGQFLADYEAVLTLASLYRRFRVQLACEPAEVRSCTGWVEGARTAVDGSDFQYGLPVRVTSVA